MVSLVAKINERVKDKPDKKVYTSKKIILNKGNYPSE